MTPKEALEKAISIVGSQTALAAEIGGDVKTGHIFYWLKAGKVPAEHCPAIERATRAKGQPVHCEELCPGPEWRELRQTASQPATQEG